MVYPNHPRYPKPPKDVHTAEQVIPSRRWEYVRMGIEDYMLLKMAPGAHCRTRPKRGYVQSQVG